MKLKTLPNRKYGVIYADPPWPDQGRVLGHSGFVDGVWRKGTTLTSVPYPTMTVAEICSLDVAKCAAKDSFLFLWVINRYIPFAYDVAKAWGFSPICLLTWAKVPMGLGLGGTFTSNTEHILFCKKGRPHSLRRFNSRWWTWKRGGRHSAKPHEFYGIIETMALGPYLELFARNTRQGWDSWGNEV